MEVALSRLIVLASMIGIPCSVFADEQGDFMKARSAYLAAVRSEAGQQEAWRNAAESLRTYISRNPTVPRRAEATFLLAECLMQLREHDEAREHFEAYLELREHGPLRYEERARFRIGEAAYLSRQYPQARSAFYEFQASFPESSDNPSASHYLGRIALVQEEPRNAVAHFQDALNRLGATESTESGGSQVERARRKRLRIICQLGCASAKEDLGELQSAREIYDQIASSELEELSFRAILKWGLLECRTGNVPTANELFVRLESIDGDHPHLPWAAYSFGEALRRSDHSAEALEYHKTVRQRWPQSPWAGASLLSAAELIEAQGDTRSAVDLLAEHYDSADQPSGPKEARAYYLLGRLCARQGDWERVIHAMSRMKDRASPLYVPSLYWTAEAYYRLGRYDDAEVRFKELSRIADMDRSSWLGMIPLRRAQILAYRGEWLKAYHMASEIGGAYPDFRQQFEVDYLLGRCLSAEGRFADARQMYHRVITSEDGSKTETAAMAQWMIGETYFHQRDYENAIRSYLRVDSRFDKFPRWQVAGLLQAGKCHELLGDPRSAISRYTTIIDQFKETEFHGEANDRLRLVRRANDDAEESLSEVVAQ